MMTIVSYSFLAFSIIFSIFVSKEFYETFISKKYAHKYLKTAFLKRNHELDIIALRESIEINNQFSKQILSISQSLFYVMDSFGDYKPDTPLNKNKKKDKPLASRENFRMNHFEKKTHPIFCEIIL